MDDKKTAVSPKRETVLTLHRSGKLEEARDGYEQLLSGAPGDADLLGLLGVVALQEGNAAEAESLLRRAVHVAHPDAGVNLRNQNNLIALLVDEGRTDAAAELADTNVLDWPDDCAPDDAVCRRTVSLAEALALAGRPERGARLVESVLAHDNADPALRDLAGRLWLHAGDAAAALPHLERAAADRTVGWQTLAALSAARGKLGQEAAAKAVALRCARAAPIYLAPEAIGQRATILTLNPTPRKITGTDGTLGSLHFTTNFISQASRLLADEFRFCSIFADLADLVPELPAADVMFNNLASGEILSKPGRLERTIALVEQLGRPVINPPEAVVETTRQKTATRLQGIPGLRVPRIERYWRDLSRFDEIATDIARQFSYPVIVRHVAADSSAKLHKTGRETAIRLADSRELRNFLERIDWPQFYVIEYVDLRKPDGNFRKIRATFVGDEIVVSRCQFYEDWMVGSQSGAAFYHRFPACAAQMHDLLRDPEAVLGIPLMAILREVRDRVPLEFFGMDFDVDDEGKVVLFEAQASMAVIPNPAYPDYSIAPKEPSERILQAFRNLVLAKIDAAV